MLNIVVLSKFYLKKFKGNKLALILIIAVVFASFSQSSIGIGTVTPHISAILDVDSTNKGFLPPRMSTTEMAAINSPTEGLIVYCFDCSPKGIYVFDGVRFSRQLMLFDPSSVEYLNIDDVIIASGTTYFDISPTLIPSGATVDYELIRKPTGVTIEETTEETTEETRINIAANIPLGEYNITVKAIGTGNYNGETGATFKLNVVRIPLTRLNIDDVIIASGTTYFDISPTLTPSDATVDYELRTNPIGGIMEGTRINISPNLDIGEYNITIKAKGTGNYTGETETTFRLRIIPNDNFVIVFQDANFETAVKENLSIAPNEEVKYSDVKDVIRLDVFSQEITNMEEIRYFPSLIELYCYNNQLTSLDLSQNTVLNVLCCQNNQLTSLDIRGMRRVDEGLIFNNTTLQTLKAHQNIKDYRSITNLKTARGNDVTIYTYSASSGSTNYHLICNNYVPRAGGGSCND